MSVRNQDAGDAGARGNSAHPASPKLPPDRQVRRFGSGSILAGGIQFADQLGAAVVAILTQHHFE